MAYDKQTNLIINYLPQTLTDEEFRSMFLSIGQLKASKIVRDRATGYSYGFGFVDYTRDEDAQRAIQTLNGLQLQNKRIKVAFSRSGESIKGANLYVSNLPKEMNQDQLEEIFADYGNIIQCRILQDQATGRSKGVGFVLFNDRAEAENAMKNCDGYIPEGGTGEISVKFADDNKGKARAPPMMQGGVPVVQGRGRGRGNFNNQFNGSGYGGANQYGGGYGGGNGYNEGNGGGFGGGDGFGGGYGEEEEMGFGQGYGGRGRGFGGATGRGGGRGGRGFGAGAGAGPMRNQNRFNRFNPMAGGQGGGGQGGGGLGGAPHGPAGGNFGNASSAGGGGGGSTGTALEGGFTLFVYNIGPQADERELWQLFSPYGTIQKVNVIRDHQKDQGKGYGFVTMTTYHEAMSAIQALNGYRYVGKPLQVSFKSNKD